MGGPSGGSTGGGGGVGPAGKTKKGTYGTTKDAKKASRRNEFSSAVKKVGNFIAKGGVTGAIIGAFKEGAKKSKQNVMDYEGQAAGVTPMRAPKDARTGRDNDNNNQPTQKSIEQPKVASQMDNSEVKSKLITADKTAPTTVEMANAELTDDERMLKVKRGKKTKTVLTDLTGLKDQPTLSKKILLG